jgi:hypothetical protein
VAYETTRRVPRTVVIRVPLDYPVDDPYFDVPPLPESSTTLQRVEPETSEGTTESGQSESKSTEGEKSQENGSAAGEGDKQDQDDAAKQPKIDPDELELGTAGGN